MGSTFTAPVATTTPDGQSLTYQSSDTSIATVNAQTGKVTLNGEGQAVITAYFAGNENYRAAQDSYTLTVSLPQTEEGYKLWIGNIQVTDENKNDILDNETITQAPSALFNEQTNTLILTNVTATTITSQLPGDLTIYLIGDNALSDIRYTGEEAAELILTTNGNTPGNLTLSSKTGSAINGFSALNLEEKLLVLLPENAVYQHQQLTDADGTTAQDVSIGVTIKPLVEEKTVSFTDSEFVTKDEEGKPVDVNLYNQVINDILYTLNADNEDGFDDTEKCIVINSQTKTATVINVAQNLKPGTAEYAESYYGLTFMVPAGTGLIILDVQTLDGNILNVMIGNNPPLEIIKTERDWVEIPYDCDEPTYVYAYSSGNGSQTRPFRPIGKKTTVHVKVYSVTVKPNNVKSSNPVQSVAPDYPNSFVADYDQVGDIHNGIQRTGIITGSNDDAWYNLHGQRIDTPKKPGLYIHRGRKTVFK